MEERLYDLIFICMPATPEEEIAKIIATLEQAIAEHGGKVEKVEKWGTRKMAYRVAKQREGFYVYMSLRSSAGRFDQGTRAAPEGVRRRDQVHDRAPGRRDQAAAEAGGPPRTPRPAASAQAGG